MQETDEMWVRFLGEKDPLEEEMGICSNILAWRIPWTEEPGGLPSTGLGQKESDMTEQLSLSLNFMAEGKPKRSNM